MEIWNGDIEKEKLSIVKDYIIKITGYLTVIKNSQNTTSINDIFTIEKTRLNISKKIKESFDPKRIFNPGKMYKDI